MKKLLLVGWDAADWKVIHPLLDKGEMPNLRRLIEGGVMGDLTTLEPILSPMLWNSIGTGKYADQHGILGFTEVDPDTRRVRPVTSTSRHAKAIWNILNQNGANVHVIHWFGGHPAEPINGVCVSDFFSRGYTSPAADWPLVQGTVHPPELAGTLAELRMAPDEVDGEMLQLFVPRAAEVDQEKDHRLASVAKIIAETVSVHTAATWAMENRPWDFMGIYYPSIDHFSHAFMNYHPPKLDWIDEASFELYKDVVNSGYRLHDLFLGRLLQLAPPDTTVIVCSDHGFHSDHLRPKAIPMVPAGPADQHRPLGMLVMHGPGIKRDETVYGATLLDITPTILNLYGLPAGQDMSGRVLLEAMEEPRPIERIPSWEAVDGAAGMHQGHVPMSADDAEALLEQFVALGYIDRPNEDAHMAAVQCERERLWNLARVYLHSRRPHLALPVLEQIWDEAPDRSDYGLVLANCQAILGMEEEARETALEAVSGAPESAAHFSTLSAVAARARHLDEAVEHIAKAAELEPDSAALALRHGELLLALRKWEAAEPHIRRALEIDPHLPGAWESLASAHARRKRWREAAEAALEAVALEHHRPRAHMLLGISLFQMERLSDAIRAFETALSFRPPIRQAHFWLSRVLMRIPGRQEEALEHRAAAREAKGRRMERREAQLQLHREAAERARGRAEKRAARREELAAKRTEELAKRREMMKRRKEQANEAKAAPQHPLELVIVSGLPRSGTSLMMQMLHAGGVPVMTDGERTADTDNPKGYFEWERVKQLGEQPHLLYDAEGKAIKVISMLLQHLPVKHRYKVIFLDRPIEEVHRSHRRMIENRQEKAPDLDANRMKENLEKHRREVLRGMAKSAAFEVLVVDYPELVRDPLAWAGRVSDFLRPQYEIDPKVMVTAVDSTLYRNRG